MRKSTETVERAVSRVPIGTPHREAIQRVLQAAANEARESEDEFEGMGLSHLRTFLKVTQTGLAILALAEEVLANYEECPYDFSHTRHWCGNYTCRDS